MSATAAPLISEHSHSRVAEGDSQVQSALEEHADRLVSRRMHAHKHKEVHVVDKHEGILEGVPEEATLKKQLAAVKQAKRKRNADLMSAVAAKWVGENPTPKRRVHKAPVVVAKPTKSTGFMAATDFSASRLAAATSADFKQLEAALMARAKKVHKMLPGPARDIARADLIKKAKKLKDAENAPREPKQVLASPKPSHPVEVAAQSQPADLTETAMETQAPAKAVPSPAEKREQEKLAAGRKAFEQSVPHDDVDDSATGGGAAEDTVDGSLPDPDEDIAKELAENAKAVVGEQIIKEQQPKPVAMKTKAAVGLTETGMKVTTKSYAGMVCVCQHPKMSALMLTDTTPQACKKVGLQHGFTACSLADKPPQHVPLIMAHYSAKVSQKAQKALSKAKQAQLQAAEKIATKMYGAQWVVSNKHRLATASLKMHSPKDALYEARRMLKAAQRKNTQLQATTLRKLGERAKKEAKRRERANEQNEKDEVKQEMEEMKRRQQREDHEDQWWNSVATKYNHVDDAKDAAKKAKQAADMQVFQQKSAKQQAEWENNLALRVQAKLVKATVDRKAQHEKRKAEQHAQLVQARLEERLERDRRVRAARKLEQAHGLMQDALASELSDKKAQKEHDKLRAKELSMKSYKEETHKNLAIRRARKIREAQRAQQDAMHPIVAQAREEASKPQPAARDRNSAQAAQWDKEIRGGRKPEAFKYKPPPEQREEPEQQQENVAPEAEADEPARTPEAAKRDLQQKLGIGSQAQQQLAKGEDPVIVAAKESVQKATAKLQHDQQSMAQRAQAAQQGVSTPPAPEPTEAAPAQSTFSAVWEAHNSQPTSKAVSAAAEKAAQLRMQRMKADAQVAAKLAAKKAAQSRARRQAAQKAAFRKQAEREEKSAQKERKATKQADTDSPKAHVLSIHMFGADNTVPEATAAHERSVEEYTKSFASLLPKQDAGGAAPEKDAQIAALRAQVAALKAQKQQQQQQPAAVQALETAAPKEAADTHQGAFSKAQKRVQKEEDPTHESDFTKDQEACRRDCERLQRREKAASPQTTLLQEDFSAFWDGTSPTSSDVETDLIEETNDASVGSQCDCKAFEPVKSKPSKWTTVTADKSGQWSY